ncbi:MAG: PAS domain S-box protein, partial [Caldilineaceae bacterium]|nr:PAS domain S-box protein [Caldilineaceae bacterium]
MSTVRTFPFKFLPLIASVVVVLVGATIVGDWIFDARALQSWLLGTPKMTANTAVGFVLSGVALALYTTAIGSGAGRRRRRFAQILAGFVFLLGLLTLSEYIFGWDLGIDQIIVKDTLGAAQVAFPGRPSPQTAFAFVLVGAALFLSSYGNSPHHHVALFLTVTAAFVALLALVGYIFGIAFFFRISAYTGMALQTAIAFLVLCVGILFLHPDRGLTSLIAAGNLGGMLARRLMLLALVVPLLTAWIVHLGQLNGLYDTAFIPILLTVLNAYVYSGAVYWFARSLDQIDVARREAEDRFRSVVEASPNALILFNRHGRISLVNRQAESLFGYTREEMLSQPTEQFLPEHLRSGHAADREAFFDAPSARPMGLGRALYGLHKDGREIPVEIGLNPITINEESFVLAAIIDITERQKASDEIEHSRRWLERVASTTPDIIFIFDIADNRNVYANRSSLDILGYTAEELTESPNFLTQIVDAADLATTQAFYAEMAHAGPGEVRLLTHRLVHKDGTIHWIESRVAPFLWDEQGNITQVIGIARDITDRKRAEEQVASYAAQLERSNRDLQDFAHVASHDLQEPLRKIIAFGDLLTSRHGDALDETGADYLERMQNAGRRMQTLINDLLSFSRVNSSGGEWQRVDLNVVTSEVIADLEQRIKQTGGEIRVGALPVLMADRTQMR